MVSVNWLSYIIFLHTDVFQVQVIVEKLVLLKVWILWRVYVIFHIVLSKEKKRKRWMNSPENFLNWINNTDAHALMDTPWFSWWPPPAAYRCPASSEWSPTSGCGTGASQWTSSAPRSGPASAGTKELFIYFFNSHAFLEEKCSFSWQKHIHQSVLLVCVKIHTPYLNIERNKEAL